MTLALRVRRTRARFALDVEVELPSRGITALFGRSGCGKTTLLRAIAGLDRVPGALVRFDAEIWQDERHFVAASRRGLGYVFQEPSLFAHLDVRRNLEYGLKRRSPAQRRLRFEEGVALLGLEALLERRPQELSGGERQRVAIARALLASPRLLLLDEPVSSLDEAGRKEVLAHLERLRERLAMPVVYVSHALEEVMRLADHLVLLEAGRVRAAGPLQELLTRTDLPLAGFEASGTLLEGVLDAQDPAFHLSFVQTAAGRLAISRRALEPGARVRVRIDARDVSVALDPPTRSSISNLLPARVVDLAADPDPAQVRLRLVAGGELLYARITRRSAVQLGLEPGTPVYAQIKSVSLME